MTGAVDPRRHWSDPACPLCAGTCGGCECEACHPYNTGADWGDQSQTTRLRDALEHIANGQQCETFTHSTCRDRGSGRRRDGIYGAERWCDTCIARDALAPAPRTEKVPWWEAPGRTLVANGKTFGVCVAAHWEPALRPLAIYQDGDRRHTVHPDDDGMVEVLIEDDR